MSAIWVLDESTAKPDRLFVFAYWAENQLIERLSGFRVLNKIIGEGLDRADPRIPGCPV